MVESYTWDLLRPVLTPVETGRRYYSLSFLEVFVITEVRTGFGFEIVGYIEGTSKRRSMTRHHFVQNYTILESRSEEREHTSATK